MFSLRTATWLGATVIVAGLATAGCSSSNSTSPSASSSPSAPKVLTDREIAFGDLIHHTFLPNGTGAAKTEHLQQPDDIVALGGKIYVGWQNGVGSQGEVSASGNLDSTLTELTPTGSVVKQWDVTGKIDGMGADPATGRVFASVNEDSKSSLYVLSGGTITHYAYAQSPLPHKGGTDAISVLNGKILISASAPGTSGKAPANAPAVYVATLNATAKTVAVAPFFAINATATSVNNGGKVTLALTDPDSNLIMPSGSPKFAGDFMLNSQGDQELIFSGATGQNLQVLKISKPVDDTAVATSASGSLFITNSSSNTVDVMTGPFKTGTAYTSVTPCNATAAPAVCPASSAPQFPANSFGMINLSTGAVSNVSFSGTLTPKGMVFVP